MIQIIGLFVLATISYMAYGAMTYTETIREKPWYALACLGCALIANLSFVLVTKKIGNPSGIFLAGLGWGLMLVFLQAAVPISMGLVQIKPGVVVGVLMVAVGTALVSYSMRG